MSHTKKLIFIFALMLCACDAPIVDNKTESETYDDSDNTPDRALELEDDSTSHRSEPRKTAEQSSQQQEGEISAHQDEEMPAVTEADCPLYFEELDLCGDFSWSTPTLNPSRKQSERDEVFYISLARSSDGEFVSPKNLRVKFMMTCCGATFEGNVKEVSLGHFEVRQLHFMSGNWDLRIQILNGDPRTVEPEDDSAVIDEVRIEYEFL